MKKLFVFLTVATLAINGAVAEKGDLALSGSLAFDYAGPELINGQKNGESFLDFRVTPSLLYGISKRMYLGGELSADMRYFWGYEANQQVFDGYRNMFGIAPILRCYAFSGRRFGFFYDTKAGVYFGSDNAKTNYTAIVASVTPGIEFFLNTHLSMSASLNEMIGFGYEHANPEGYDNSTDRTFFRFIFNRAELNYAPLTFTFTYHFRKVKQEIEIIEIDEYRIVR